MSRPRWPRTDGPVVTSAVRRHLPRRSRSVENSPRSAENAGGGSGSDDDTATGGVEARDPSGPDGGGTHGSDGDSTEWTAGTAPGDTLAGSVRDRQVLIVGATPAGLVLAALLDRGGYEPLVVAGGEPPRRSRVSRLWPSSLGVLDRAGVDLEPSGSGPTVDPGAVRAARGRVGAVGRDAGECDRRPVVVRTARLRERLKAAAPDPSLRRGVAGIDVDDGALEVTFDDGVGEWFDVVIGADGPESTVRALHDGGAEPPRLDQFETAVAVEDPTRTVDAWTDRGLAQLRPLPGDGEALLRLTTARDRGPEPGLVRRNLAAVEDGPLAAVEVGDPTDVRHESVAQTGGRDGYWGHNRVAYCGGSALPLAPATGLRTALALDDAWVLADELLGGSRSVDDAIHTYASRRERRVERLLSSGAGAAGDPGRSDGPPLPGLERFRRAAVALLEDPSGPTLDPGPGFYPGPDPGPDLDPDPDPDPGP